MTSSSRPGLLAIVERVDPAVSDALRAVLADWLVVVAVEADAATATKAFQLECVVVVGDVSLSRSLWSALELCRLAPHHIGYAQSVQLVATAVHRLRR